MHRMAERGIMPPQMTYTGRNFDIVTGATAIVVAALLGGPRWQTPGPRLESAWSGSSPQRRGRRPDLDAAFRSLRSRSIEYLGGVSAVRVAAGRDGAGSVGGTPDCVQARCTSAMNEPSVASLSSQRECQPDADPHRRDPPLASAWHEPPLLYRVHRFLTRPNGGSKPRTIRTSPTVPSALTIASTRITPGPGPSRLPMCSLAEPGGGARCVSPPPHPAHPRHRRLPARPSVSPASHLHHRNPATIWDRAGTAMRETVPNAAAAAVMETGSAMDAARAPVAKMDPGAAAVRSRRCYSARFGRTTHKQA